MVPRCVPALGNAYIFFLAIVSNISIHYRDVLLKIYHQFVFAVEPDNCTVQGQVCNPDNPCCEGLSCEPQPGGGSHGRIFLCIPTSPKGNALIQRVHHQIIALHSFAITIVFLYLPTDPHIYPIDEAKDLPPGTGEEYGKCGGICCNKPCWGPCWPCKEGLKCVGKIDSDGNGEGICLKGRILFAIFMYNIKALKLSC